MVLQKRLDYGFNGYRVPAIPRGSRSARSKGSTKKKNADNQMYAFDLLATVAGKLLQEKDISPGPCDVEPGRTQENGEDTKEKDECYRKNGEQALLGLGLSLTNAGETIKQEPVYEKLFKVEPCDQGSSDESVLASGTGSRRHMSCQALNYTSKEYSRPQDTGDSRAVSRITKSDSSEHVGYAKGSIFDMGRNGLTNSSVESVFSRRDILKTMPERIHVKYRDWKGSPEDLIDRKLITEQGSIGAIVNGTAPNMCTSEESMKVDTKPNGLISSDSSVDIPLCDAYITCSFPNCRDDVKKVVSRDDDENSSGCTQPKTISVKAFRPSCLGNWKVRKMLASEFLNVAPKLESDGEICNTDMEVKPVFHRGKACYTRQRTQRSSYKRRKLFGQNSIATSDKGIAREDMCSSPENGIEGEVPGSDGTMQKTSDPLSPEASTKLPFKSGDSHVKLSIKSFKVPELCIEMPETATIATLKKAVMDAVISILGDGVEVGLLLHGNKVCDDDKTLIQTGISDGDKLDSVGFMLEPSSPPVSSPCVFSSPATQPITRYPTLTLSEQVVVDAIPGPLVTSSGSWSESDHDSVLSPNADLPQEKKSPDSRALVALPTMSVEALAVVPFHRKSRREDLVQRRMRRPFSVSEVEALVQAVEKLGTGRWRDVKLCAFDNAKHRTYVDLKDKWKTLVHTARISPQQRRGEPVPQELLNRVLAAHAYWSQQQAKQQAKQQEEPCLLL